LDLINILIINFYYDLIAPYTCVDLCRCLRDFHAPRLCIYQP